MRRGRLGQAVPSMFIKISIGELTRFRAERGNEFGSVRVGWVSRRSRRNPPYSGGLRLASSADPPYETDLPWDLQVTQSGGPKENGPRAKWIGSSGKIVKSCHRP